MNAGKYCELQRKVIYKYKLNINCCLSYYRYRVFGDPPSQRAAEDIAFSVARFFSKNGSLVNYYMVSNTYIYIYSFSNAHKSAKIGEFYFKEFNWFIVLLQYHGGTNFGRTSAVFTTTRYYDEAPLDEYGKCVSCLSYNQSLTFKSLLRVLNFCTVLMPKAYKGNPNGVI